MSHIHTINPIEDFRQNIRKLNPDGEDGFEGLMSAVLSDLTGRSFALASAGSQRGKDGQSSRDGGVIVFEAKRYDEAVPKDKIYTKIFEIAADRNSVTELFVLGATSPISAQHISTLKDGARKFSMALIVLDWPEHGLAGLAVLFAMAPSVSAKFISKHTLVNESELEIQLSAIRAHSQFQARAEELSAILWQPSIAPAFALKDNILWLSNAFSDKKRARSVFGQALSPLDTSTSGTIDRTDLKIKVTQSVFAKPNGAITAILGADGNGKSWIFAQAWGYQSTPPLTVVIVPEDIGAMPSLEYCQELIVSKLLTQTGEVAKLEAKERWLRHFENWRKKEDSAVPRLVVFIDGINQRESVNWLMFMDIMSTVVAQIGGRLVFSCRRIFYSDHLENKLVSRVMTIEVPEWSDVELNELLRERGTSIEALDPSIVRSLRNPRIFGVAAELFNTEQITEFGELSVNRLLFEHIRSGGAVKGSVVSSRQFTAEIRVHAESIVERLKRNQLDSLNEFDMPTIRAPGPALSEQFVITSAGRFFEVLDEDPNKYILKEDGLPLALGLALVRTAREAQRKNKSVIDALSNVLDPIVALDKTGDILLGAILAAVLEDESKEIVAPLVRSFVMLQNLDSSRRPEFRSLFNRSPSAFLFALEDAALSHDTASNLSWLIDTTTDLRGNVLFEREFSDVTHRWLSMYSLSPARMVRLPNNSQHAAERETKWTEREHEIAAIMKSLSSQERKLLAEMNEEKRGDYSQLNLLAFLALAGRPLAPFSSGIRNWCFAAALNGGYHDHREEFNDLLHFNLIDWASTREALRDVAEILRNEDISRTGQWALVSILRATGDGNDAKEADRIAELLTRDRDHMKGWRRIEDYCANDPCDPNSELPGNIDQTADAYQAIDASELVHFRKQSNGDLFFRDAQPGLARFRPDAAINVLRSLADETVTRSQLNFRSAALYLAAHTSALEDRIALPYIEKARELAQSALDVGEDKNNETWIAAQYALFVAFPHMTGDEQFDALIAHPEDQTILADLGHVFRPISEIKLALALEAAIQQANSLAQFRILCFAEHSRTVLSAHAKKLIISILNSSNDHVRLSALALIRSTADSELLIGVARSDWSVAHLDAVANKIEIFYGSEALALAAGHGLISVDMCLQRMGSSAYELLVQKLGDVAVTAIADILDKAVQDAVRFRVTGNLPDIEQSFEGKYWPVMLEVSEKPLEDEADHQKLQRLSEVGDAWHERQRLSQEAAECFERSLTRAGAELIIKSTTPDLILAIDKISPVLLDNWCALLLSLNDQAFSNLYNFAAIAAQVVSPRAPSISVALFERLKSSSPHVRVTFGRNKIPIDSTTLWSAADNPEMRRRQFSRLDQIDNDHDLAMEVLAVIKAKRLDLLRDYVLERRSCAEPAHRGRASMVAGYATDEPWAIETINMLKNEQGFLGQVYEAAKYAMDRYQWSCHWTRQMQAATSPEDLWRYSVLLSKIVDGRFRWSEIDGCDKSDLLIKRFCRTFDDPIRNRIRKWKGKRESKLFGMKMPNKIFLRSA